jgi:hypothetical protein
MLLGEDSRGGLEDRPLGDTPNAGEHPEAPSLETIRATGTSNGVGELAAEPAQHLVGGCPPMRQLIGRETRQLEHRQQVCARRIPASRQQPQIPDKSHMRAQASHRVKQRTPALPRAPASREGKRRHKRCQQRSESSDAQNERRDEHVSGYDRGSQERHTLISARPAISVMPASAGAPEWPLGDL